MFCVYVMLVSTAKVRVGALIIKVRYQIEFTFIQYNTRCHTEPRSITFVYNPVYQKGSFWTTIQANALLLQVCSCVCPTQHLNIYQICNLSFTDAYYTCMLRAHLYLHIYWRLYILNYSIIDIWKLIDKPAVIMNKNEEYYIIVDEIYFKIYCNHIILMATPKETV